MALQNPISYNNIKEGGSYEQNIQETSFIFK